MKKLLQGALLPFVIFTSGVLLFGCDQAQNHHSDTAQVEDQSADDSDRNTDDKTDVTDTHQENNDSASRRDLKSGNMFYIARDVADMQLKTGDYVKKIEQIQTDLQQALDEKDQHQLQKTVKNLSYQLHGFNDALNSLDLKSEEVDSVRSEVLKANKQVLNSSLLNGDVDLNKINFDKIQKQMNSIQTDMLQLAALMIPSSNHNDDQDQ